MHVPALKMFFYFYCCLFLSWLVFLIFFFTCVKAHISCSWLHHDATIALWDNKEIEAFDTAGICGRENLRHKPICGSIKRLKHLCGGLLLMRKFSDQYVALFVGLKKKIYEVHWMFFIHIRFVLYIFGKIWSRHSTSSLHNPRIFFCYASHFFMNKRIGFNLLWRERIFWYTGSRTCGLPW
jgi:hypothetical protein